MNELCHYLMKRFPCRSEVVKTLSQLIGVDPAESYPAAIYLYGHSGTGKTALLKELLRRCKHKCLRYAYLNCVECYSTKIFVQSILGELSDEPDEVSASCDNIKDLMGNLRNLHLNYGYIIALDNAERLRDMEANVLPSLLRLQELTGLNVCVVLISQIPFEKYYMRSGLSEIATVHCPQYTKNETLRILSSDFENAKYLVRNRLRQKQWEKGELERKLGILDTIKSDSYNNYLNLFLSVFYKACRDLLELKITSRKCFVVYVEPILDGIIEETDVNRLWRNIAATLKVALAQVYMRFDQSQDAATAGSSNENVLHDQSVRKMAQSLELPYYGKYLLIAAFLASHNSAKEDKRLFVKNSGKQRKRMQTVNAHAKVTEKMSTSLGPKSFSIDRLLAIFYAILEEKVGLTCNLLSQISTLVHLKLLSFVSGENNVMDGSSRLQCTVGLEFVLYIGKVVGFNVRQYLCDFM